MHIPFHSSHPFADEGFAGFAVVPTDGRTDPASLRDSTKRSYEALEWLKSIAPSPGAQAKYQRSSQWLYEIQMEWGNVVFWNDRLKEGQGA